MTHDFRKAAERIREIAEVVDDCAERYSDRKLTDSATSLSTIADAIEAENARLREALSGLLGDERLETALWGDLPDDAIGSITTRLGKIRAARAALEAAEAKP